MANLHFLMAIMARGHKALEFNGQNISNNTHRDEVKLVSSRLLTSKIDSGKIFEETNRVTRDDSSWNEEIKQVPSISLSNLRKLSVETEYSQKTNRQ